MALLVAVSLLSAAAIGYEILLTRLFSIVLWHHFAFMIVSLALLGVGASGSFIALAREWLEPRFSAVFAGFATAFGLTAAGGFALARRIPFNPLEVVWDPRQQLYLLGLYLLLAVPFFCAATCVGLALCRTGARIAMVYRADLMGAGLGALLVVLLLFVLAPQDCLRALSGLGMAAGALAALHGRAGGRRVAALLALALALPFAWPAAWIRPEPSPYKGLSLALETAGARVVNQRSSPLGLLTVVESPEVPFRHAPGLSLMAPAGVAEQLGVFTDGDAFTAIVRYDGARAPLAYLDWQTAALPFHLLERPRTLVLGAGGGADVLLARYHGAASIDAVELDPALLRLVRRDHRDFAGPVFDAEDVRVHVGEGRSFVDGARGEWDLIQLSLVESLGASAAGVLSLTESGLYTVEAFEAYLAHLAPGGLLAITRWLKLPPRDALKLLATARAALERQGVARPEERLALIRGSSTTTLLVKRGAFGPEDAAAIRAFCRSRAFDPAFYPGMRADEANRFTRLPQPYLFEGATALLGAERQRFIEGYKFEIAPATDDRPYFFRFFKWRILPEVLAMRGRAGLTLLEGGYLVVVATLAQAVLVGALLILLPLRWLRRRDGAAAGIGRPRVAAYFVALGIGFLFVEMAFIQRFVLFLGHPLYAIAVVLCAFLVCAGLGSGYAGRLPGWRAPLLGLPALALAAVGVIACAGLYAVLLPALFGALAAQPTALKIALSIALIAPLAFAMGMPFPLGLARVADQAPALTPWAWAVNGCTSVASVVLASLLATHLGFTAVIAMAMAAYGVAALLFAR